MSQMISIANKPKILNDVVWRKDGESDQIIVLSKETLALPLILNPTAARIFLLCNGKNSLEDIAGKLCDEFGLEDTFAAPKPHPSGCGLVAPLSINPSLSLRIDFKMVLKDVKEQVEYFFNKGIIET